MRLVLLLLALPVWATDDANVILQRLIEASARNDLHAHQYTYVEETERFTFNRKGEAHKTESERHDVIFVEGLEYRKLVARNGKPLGRHEQQEVEREMRQTAEDRRLHQRPLAAGGMVTFSGLFSHRSLDLGSLRELLTLYDNHVVGKEEVRGHKTWVIECRSRDGYVPRSEHERQVLVFAKKFWVDEAEGTLVRSIYTVAAEDAGFTAGSSLTFEFEKVDSETWEPVSLTLDFSREKVFRPTVRTVYRMSDFKKFDVQSTITVGYPEK